MTRARAAWIVAAGIVVLAVIGYLVRRQSRAAPVATAPQPTLRGTAVPALGVSTAEQVVPDAQLLVEVEEPMRTDAGAVADSEEQPLPTWVRVAIIAVALLAFFAVSLIATKQV